MNRIAILRKERKLSQKQFGAIIGVAQNTISNWEHGNRDPDYESLKKMAYFFNCSTDYLLGRTDEKKPIPKDRDGLDSELAKLIKRIPADRMPEVERYLRFQADQKETP